MKNSKDKIYGDLPSKLSFHINTGPGRTFCSKLPNEDYNYFRLYDYFLHEKHRLRKTNDSTTFKFVDTGNLANYAGSKPKISDWKRSSLKRKLRNELIPSVKRPGKVKAAYRNARISVRDG